MAGSKSSTPYWLKAVIVIIIAAIVYTALTGGLSAPEQSVVTAPTQSPQVSGLPGTGLWSDFMDLKRRFYSGTINASVVYEKNGYFVVYSKLAKRDVFSSATPEDALEYAVKNFGYVTLGSDLELGRVNVTAQEGVIIDGAGHTLTLSGPIIVDGSNILIQNLKMKPSTLYAGTAILVDGSNDEDVENVLLENLYIENFAVGIMVTDTRSANYAVTIVNARVVSGATNGTALFINASSSITVVGGFYASTTGAGAASIRIVDSERVTLVGVHAGFWGTNDGACIYVDSSKGVSVLGGNIEAGKYGIYVTGTDSRVTVVGATILGDGVQLYGIYNNGGFVEVLNTYFVNQASGGYAMYSAAGSIAADYYSRKKQYQAYGASAGNAYAIPLMSSDEIGRFGYIYMYGDIRFLSDNYGVILIDRATGTAYKLYVDNGTLKLEPV